jgi:ribose 5-phosphate isomerase B
MRIAIGSDHRGVQLRAKLVTSLQEMGHEVTDAGTHETASIDYPDIAAVVARQVSRNDVDRGVLICGTGIGMAISANKFSGVRATPCHDDFQAEMCRRHNDVNVLCLGADLLGNRNVDQLVKIWLETDFEGGRHARRVDKITGLEEDASS